VVRYVTPLVPFLCLTAAIAVVFVATRVGQIARVNIKGLRAVVAAGLVVLIAAPSVVSDVHFDRLMTIPDTRLLAARWLEEHMKPGASLSETGVSSRIRITRGADARRDYALVAWNERRQAFTSAAGAEQPSPDWIVVARSPLRAYHAAAADLQTILNERYQLVAQFNPSPEPEAEVWFDRQDAWLVPIRHLDVKTTWAGFVGYQRR
jgi:hypothetical protein